MMDLDSMSLVGRLNILNVETGIINAGNIYTALSDFVTTTKKSHCVVSKNKQNKKNLT